LLPGPSQSLILNTGLFALSGGLTNWLAVHMLFERIPGFYGSGVIPLRFEQFKQGIHDLIMEQFFNKSNLDKFFQDATEIADKLEQEIAAGVERLDLDQAFDSLLDAIMESSLGNMLGMIGGRGALGGLKEPFKNKMKAYLLGLFGKESFRQHLQEAVRNSVESEAVLAKLHAMIDLRLDEMTPQLVKEIVESMIRQHLGWLVVWGSVIGGIMGLIFTLISQLTG